MNKLNLQLSEIKLVGITTRTKNSYEFNPKTAKIGKTIDHYFSNSLNKKILRRIKPETTYCAYTEYESDENSEYTYFIGEEVDSFEQIDPMFTTLIIPSSNYAKFQSGPGKMPMVCIDAWQKIWQMSNYDLGGKRTYNVDFEVYDERAKDYNNTILDIYIGIK